MYKLAPTFVPVDESVPTQMKATEQSLGFVVLFIMLYTNAPHFAS